MRRSLSLLRLLRATGFSYLTAKRAVEANLLESASRDPGVFRPILYRPSLIWDWSKLDVLPVIPIFNAAAAVGVPFVDRTVRVETLAAAIVAGLEDGSVSGPQRIVRTRPPFRGLLLAAAAAAAAAVVVGVVMMLCVCVKSCPAQKHTHDASKER